MEASGLHGRSKQERREGGQEEEEEERNVRDIMKWYFTYSLLAPRGIHVTVLRSTVRGKNECSSTEIFFFLFLDFQFPKSQKFQSLRSGPKRFFKLISIFLFPQCCNVGSHGSNFDVFKGAFPTREKHLLVVSIHCHNVLAITKW